MKGRERRGRGALAGTVGHKLGSAVDDLNQRLLPREAIAHFFELPRRGIFGNLSDVDVLPEDREGNDDATDVDKGEQLQDASNNPDPGASLRRRLLDHSVSSVPAPVSMARRNTRSA